MNKRTFLASLIAFAASLNQANAMESPLPFIFESDKGPSRGIVPTCHSLDFLTREFLPIHALDWEIRHSSIESHSLTKMTIVAGRPVYDITLALDDTYYDKIRMTVVGVGSDNHCPIYLRIFNDGVLTGLETIAVDLGSATVVATEQNYSGTGRHWDVAYFLFAPDGRVIEWDPWPAIGEAVSGLVPESCRGSSGNPFDLRNLRWRTVVWCGEDRFSMASKGTVEVNFRFEGDRLVSTRRVPLPPGTLPPTERP